MPSYAVRIRNDGNRRGQLVGLFSAESIYDICHLVDEFCSPLDCECAIVESFGIELTARRKGAFTGGAGLIAFRSVQNDYEWIDMHDEARCWLDNFTGRKEDADASAMAEAIFSTLQENLHLADGDVCTLKKLKDVA